MGQLPGVIYNSIRSSGRLTQLSIVRVNVGSRQEVHKVVMKVEYSSTKLSNYLSQNEVKIELTLSKNYLNTIYMI